MFAKHVDMEHACVTSMRLGTVKFTASVSSLFMCAANCFMPSMLNAKVLPALQDGVADGSPALILPTLRVLHLLRRRTPRKSREGPEPSL